MYAIDKRKIAVENGRKYDLRIRGADESNPVLLYLHGGPGGTDRGVAMKYLEPLASICTLVFWDQPGVGKAFRWRDLPKKTTHTVDSYIESLRDVMCWLKKRFRRDKIHVLGHSFGTKLGVAAAVTYPEHFAAYIGTAQCTNLFQEVLSYDFTMEEALKRNDRKALKVLKKIDRPVNGEYRRASDIRKQRKICGAYGGIVHGKGIGNFEAIALMLKEYLPFELFIKNQIGGGRVAKALAKPFREVDLFEVAQRVEMPVYILEGRHDYCCPFESVEKWFAQLEAPHKELVWFENSGHLPMIEEPERFNKTIAERVFQHSACFFSADIL